MSLDGNSSKSIIASYASSVREQIEYATQYEQNVRQVLVPKDKEAEETVDESHKNLQYATGVFDAASSDKLTLQEQKKRIEAERNTRISEAREKAEKEGKSREEIDSIVGQISAEYVDRLANLDFNIQRAGRTTLLKQNTLAQAKSIYQNDRFGQIATSNDVYSGFLHSSMLWSDVGKMQRNLAFMQTVADMGQGKNIHFEC